MSPKRMTCDRTGRSGTLNQKYFQTVRSSKGAPACPYRAGGSASTRKTTKPSLRVSGDSYGGGPQATDLVGTYRCHVGALGGSADPGPQCVRPSGEGWPRRRLRDAGSERPGLLCLSFARVSCCDGRWVMLPLGLECTYSVPASGETAQTQPNPIPTAAVAAAIAATAATIVAAVFSRKRHHTTGESHQ